MNLKEQILEILGTTKGLPDSDITRMLEKQNNEAADKIIALFQQQQRSLPKPEVSEEDIKALFEAHIGPAKVYLTLQPVLYNTCILFGKAIAKAASQ